MSFLLRFALLGLLLSAVPSQAHAQGGLWCKWFPSFCNAAPTSHVGFKGADCVDDQGSNQGAAVPELDGSVGASAGALLMGAAMLLSNRRRRRRAQ